MSRGTGDYGDAFPQLGSVYGKAWGGQVKRSSSSVGKPSQEGQSAVKAWGPRNSTASPWGQGNVMQNLGVQSDGNGRNTQNAHFQNVPSAIGNGFPSSQWNASSKSGPNSIHSTSGGGGFDNQGNYESMPKPQFGGVGNDNIMNCYDSDYDYDDDDDDDDDDEILFESDDEDGDDILDDDAESETSLYGHEKRKQSKWFRSFFGVLDKMSVEVINSTSREWHCPACKDGAGAIDWYRGLDPLIYHARTKKNRRAKLHRIFAETLEVEANRRGILLTALTDAFGRWEGLNEKVQDHQIVWPPMVVIMNTRYEQEDNGKWTGMGNQELLDYFDSYAAMKARHAYGPQGHRGMSVLIFIQSPPGYLEAARLHNHFKEQGRDRSAWDRNRVPFCPGGKRQLYGFIALKEDMDIFNQHSPGKSKLKYEMVSYQERVGSQIKEINEKTQEAEKYKIKFLQQQRLNETLTKSVSTLGEKVRRTVQDNQIIRQRTELMREQNKEEMDSLENFFKDQVDVVRQATRALEESYEKQQQAQRERVMQSNGIPSPIGDAHSIRSESIARFIKLKDEEMAEYEAEREKLIKNIEEKKTAITKRYWEEKLELEKELEDGLTKLMQKHKVDCP